MFTAATSRRRLLLTFSLIYWPLTALLIGGSYYVMHQAMIKQVIALGETSNTVLAQGFAQSIWPRFGHYIKTVGTTDGDALRGRIETLQLRELTRTLAQNLPVLKLKIYNLQGLTVYSSQESQIGEEKTGNPGYEQAAKQGLPASSLSQRGSFSGFHNVVADVALAETYVPIRNAQGDVEGVFELYTDISAAYTVTQSGLLQQLLLTGTLCALGYGLLLWALHRQQGRANHGFVQTEQHLQRQMQNLQDDLTKAQQQWAAKVQEVQMLRRYVAERA